MDDFRLDTDGYSEENRRSIVESAMARVRARHIEPKAEVLAIYDQYIAGTISRQETSNLMNERLISFGNQLAKAMERANK